MNKKNVIRAKPMPEIFLLDPITGKLPKNYKELLAKKRLDNFPEGKSSSTINVPKLKAVRMPELQFLDPVTGKFPKNVQELIKKNKEAQVLKLSNDSPTNIQQIKINKDNTKRRSKNLEFKISTLDTKRQSLPDSAGQTNNNYNKVKIIRKALFTNEEDRFSQKIKKPKSTEVDETLPLLDIEETEQKILLPKKKLKSSPNLMKPNWAREKTSVPLEDLSVKPSSLEHLKKSTPVSKSPVTSSGSLEEFIKLEQQNKTPKDIHKANLNKDSDILKEINEIKTKLNENDQLFKMIESNNTEIKCSLGILIRHLNIPDSKLKSDDNGNCNSDSDNVENAENVYNKSTKLITKRSSTKNNLRVTTMQKNLKRRVLFDLNGNEDCDSPITIKQSKSTQKLSLIQTPNTMCRVTKTKALEQYIKLKGTPKA